MKIYIRAHFLSFVKYRIVSQDETKYDFAVSAHLKLNKSLRRYGYIPSNIMKVKLFHYFK